MQSTVTPFVRHVAADHRALSEARLALRRWLVDIAPADEAIDMVRSDVEVVVGELAANVIDHTASRFLIVEVERRADHIVVVVTNDGPATGIARVDNWSSASTGRRGRGLGLIRALCSGIGVDDRAGRTRITCEIPVSALLR